MGTKPRKNGTGQPVGASAYSIERDLSRFRPVATVREDGRGRINLTGSERPHKPDAYKQYVGEGGEILLVPVKEIPERELWLWQHPVAMAAVQQGLAESAAGLATPFDMALLEGAEDEG